MTPRGIEGLRGVSLDLKSLGSGIERIADLIRGQIAAITSLPGVAATPVLSDLLSQVEKTLHVLRSIERMETAEPTEGVAAETRAEELGRAAQQRVRSLYSGDRPVPGLLVPQIPRSGDAWSLVESAVRGSGLQGLLSADRTDPGWPARVDEAFVTWFPPKPEGGEGFALSARLREPSPAADPIEAKFPRWLVVDAGGQMDLVSLPWVWWVAPQTSLEDIRLFYDRLSANPIEHQHPGRTVVSVQDRKWFALLEFVTSGRLFQAGVIADAVVGAEVDSDDEAGPETALYSKHKGPLLAVAGAIVLLARTTTAGPQPWDRWLVNLASWFPGIPDGPILLAHRTLQTATSEDDLETAFAHLQDGFARGIPFMSATIRIMALALARLGSDIEAADDLRHRIGAVAARVDPDQPFTVIRLASRR